MRTPRPVTAAIRNTGPLDPTRITGPSIAIYDTLIDGQWREEDEVIAATARAVPAAKGLRRQIGKDATPPTGAAYVRATAAGQRKVARNLLLIAIRGRRVEQHPDNPRLHRLAPGAQQAWSTHRRATP